MVWGVENPGAPSCWDCMMQCLTAQGRMIREWICALMLQEPADSPYGVGFVGEPPKGEMCSVSQVMAVCYVKLVDSFLNRCKFTVRDT
jgi:hypothetical protein